MKRWSGMLAAMVVVLALATPLWAYEVVVLPGNEAVIDWLKAENWWGQEKKAEQLQVPRIMITGISERWQKNAANMPVSQKKGVFYRLILPLAMHANEMVLDRREKLKKMDAAGIAGRQRPEDSREYGVGFWIYYRH